MPNFQNNINSILRSAGLMSMIKRHDAREAELQPARLQSELEHATTEKSLRKTAEAESQAEFSRKEELHNIEVAKRIENLDIDLPSKAELRRQAAEEAKVRVKAYNAAREYITGTHTSDISNHNSESINRIVTRIKDRATNDFTIDSDQNGRY